MYAQAGSQVRESARGIREGSTSGIIGMPCVTDLRFRYTILTFSCRCDGRPPAATVTTFSNTSGSSNLLAVATSALELLLLNPLTGSIVRQSLFSSPVTQLHYSHSFLLSGDANGFVRCHDPRTGLRRDGGAEATAKAHESEIQGLQSSGSYVYTIGWGLRYVFDPFKIL